MHHAVLSNPFRQPAKQWQIRVPVQAGHYMAIEEAFGDLASATSSFELDEAAGKWMVEIITDTPPDPADIAARLSLVAAMLDIPDLSHTASELAPRDWVDVVERSFPPLRIGRFYVYGSHVKSPAPPGSTGLAITAGAAFGSGEHATTSGCLRALDRLALRRRFRRPLDMGCGSGILAIAMAKLWHARVTGIDIDPVSIQVAGRNARLNQVHRLLDWQPGNGYSAPLARRRAPFDLIVANILARPLAAMAPQLARCLVPGGIAILSGLLASQERRVLAAHRAQGLALEHRIARNGWRTLILSKSYPH